MPRGYEGIISESEKLGCNLKVLKEKHKENQHLSDEFKRKNRMMTNRFRKLRKDMLMYDLF